MKNRLLITTAAAVLALGTGFAAAQDKSKEGAAPAPPAIKNAPAEIMAPPLKGAEQKKDHKAPAETTGQAPKQEPKLDSHPAQSGAADKAKDDAKSGAQEPAKAPAKSNAADDKAAKPDSKASDSGSNAKSGATSGQGAAAGAANLSTEQRSKISAVIKQQNVKPVSVNFSVSVGTRVPRTVHFYPLPQDVVVIYPEWRGYDYILVGDQIVIIDPRTLEIVAIIAV